MGKQQRQIEYLVWGPQTPRKKHQCHQAALKEAHRLAKKNPGVEFALVEIKKVIVHALEPETQPAALLPSSPLGPFVRGS